MKDGYSIEVSNVKKSFKVYLDKSSELKERVLFWKRNRYEMRQVLRGISFDVKKGEAIGLIGHNGCGKSTSLKLLSKIIYPDSGSIEIAGRVSSLIELGAGFHPDMSGRENIYNNAYIFGLKKKEIDERMDDIIAFSELEDYIDNPVRTYSSGMYMRLAFSVAINVDADVLLIDEILAVGDANYQVKCFDKLREIKKQGTTIVIVSHSLGQIEQICDRTLWLQDGIVRKQGAPKDVHPLYLSFMEQERKKIEAKEKERLKTKGILHSQTGADLTESDEFVASDRYEENKDADRFGNQRVEITEVDVIRKDKNQGMVFQTGDSFDVNLSYQVNQEVVDAVFGVFLYRNDGILCFGTDTLIDGLAPFALKKRGNVLIHFSDTLLLEGEYSLGVQITTDSYVYYDFIRCAKKIYFKPNAQDIGVSRLLHTWEIDKKEYAADYSKDIYKKLDKELSKQEIEKKLSESEDNIVFDNNWYDVEKNESGQLVYTMGRKKAFFYMKNFGCGIWFKVAYGGEVHTGLKIKTMGKTWDYRDFSGYEEIVYDNDVDKGQEWIEFEFEVDDLWNPNVQLGVIDNRDLGAVLIQPEWRASVNKALKKDGLNAVIIPETGFLNGVGDSHQVVVNIKNASSNNQVFSSDGECPVKLSYRVYDLKENIVLQCEDRAVLPRTLLPGDECKTRVGIDLSSLDNSTAYWVHITLVQDGCFWFEDVNEEIVAKVYVQ